MSSSDDKLIKNYCLFISLYENRSIPEKISNVMRCLEEGADVNARDANNRNNSPLHIAVQKGQTDIVQLLVSKGSLNQKNSLGKTPLELANDLISADKRAEIIKILNNISKPCQSDRAKTSLLQETQIAQKKTPKQSKKQKKEFLYSKRAGTSGVCGQLYETKLLSLVLLRALNDEEISRFHLGTNISGIGALDDICMRYEVTGRNKDIMVFVQAKHREDREKNRLTVEDVCNETGDFSLPKYFDSYLRIKESFRSNNEDDLFQEEFNNVECNLIIYTPAKDDFKRKREKPNELSVKVNDLIQTGSEVDLFQYEHNEDDIAFLTKMTVEDRIKKLGPTFLHFIMAEKDKSEMMMTDELIKRYHVVLGREVIEIMDTDSKQGPSMPSTSAEIPPPIKTNKQNLESKLYHMAKFRPEFFTSTSEFLICLRQSLYKEISSTRCDKTLIEKGEALTNIEVLVQNPCASAISKLISKIVTYNEKSKTLEIIENNNIKKEFQGNHLNQVKQSLASMTIDTETIRDAVRIKLQSIEFKLPISFGNIDMTIRGNGPKASKRLDEVAENIAEKVLKSNTKKIINEMQNIVEVEINDNLVGSEKDQITQGFLDINGGIGGAVGNALIQDEVTRLIKFNTRTTLPPKANEFIVKMSKKIGMFELERYRIRMNINGFPKYSFEGDEYDKRQAKDFLDQLWFYTNQAKEDEVENILKSEINKHYNNKEINDNQFVFRIHSDAIYLRSHDEIQKWWMQSGKAPYLTNSNEFFEQAKKEVIDSPLLTLLNLMCLSKIKKLDVRFHETAINTLELQENLTGMFNIVTEANALSGIKVMQHFQSKEINYSFIDFDYVLSLPLNDYNTMIGELKNTQIQNLIVMYDRLKHYEGFCNKLRQVIDTFGGNRIVIVSDIEVADSLKKEYLKSKYNSVHDNNTYLIDLEEESQTKILEETKVIFQDEEQPLSAIIDQKPYRGLVRTELLLKILNDEKLVIGHSTLDPNYRNIKDCFIERHLCRDDEIKVNTLNDINEKTVVVSATSGMGRTSLLSHLSHKTKEISPLPWLVRVNLLDHEMEFRMWQEKEIVTDHTTTIKFLCNVAMNKCDFEIDITLSEDNEIILANAEDITDPTALFELELFISLFNEDKAIFLFDDFNAMCPHYEKEVIEILKFLHKSNKRMWVTTCSYRHTQLALERVFGAPYKLRPLDAAENKNFLNRFFSTNLRLEKLNYDQFENIFSFMKYMSKSLVKKEPKREYVPALSLVFHYVYITAANFFQSEINHVSPSVLNEKFKKEFEIDFNQYTPIDEILGRTPDDEELELAGTPLHVYLAANYFKCRIEDCFAFMLDEPECRDKWDLMMNTFTLYRNFIEDEMRRFLIMDHDDNSISSFGDSKREFLNKHKKLGLFTLCRQNDLAKLLKEDEIIEIKDTIEKIKSGEVKSCLIDCVVGDMPRFGHLIFAEYFAMEGLADLMHRLTEDDFTGNPLKNASLWQALFNILLFKAPPGLRRAFDYKLQSDRAFAELTNSDMCRKVLFEVLLKADHAGTAEAALSAALQDRLRHVANLFLSAAQTNLNRGNVDEVIDLVKRSGLIVANFKAEYTKLLDNVLTGLKDFDMRKLSEIIESGALTEVPLRHANEYCSSPAVHDLTRRLADTTQQLPALVQALQQVCQGAAEIGPSVGNVIVTLAETGMQAYLSEFVDRMQTVDVDSDDDT